MLKFVSSTDANARLGESIIRFEGEPIYVRGISSNYSMMFSFLKNPARNTETLLSNPGVNMRPVPLGYINTNRGCYYISRAPKRKWKQGLELASITFLEYTRAPINLHDYFRDLRKCILGEYPSIKEAYSISRREGYSVAFSRTFAIDPYRHIYMKGKDIGHIDDGHFTINDQCKYLKECVEEVLDEDQSNL